MIYIYIYIYIYKVAPINTHFYNTFRYIYIYIYTGIYTLNTGVN